MVCAAKGGMTKSEILYHLSTWEVQGGLAPLVGKQMDLTDNTWAGVKIEHLPFGMALGVVDLVDCIRTDDMTLAQMHTAQHFGDFSLGRYAWRLDNVQPFKNPRPITGGQRIFNIKSPWITGQAMANTLR